MVGREAAEGLWVPRCAWGRTQPSGDTAGQGSPQLFPRPAKSADFLEMRFPAGRKFCSSPCLGPVPFLLTRSLSFPTLPRASSEDAAWEPEPVSAAVVS